MSTDKRSDLKARIAEARRAIAYAVRSEKEATAIAAELPPELRARIKTDADSVRKAANGLLQILLAELEQTKK